MDNVTFIQITDPLTNKTITHVIIDRGNNEFTSMPKAVWDELQANQLASNIQGVTE